LRLRPPLPASLSLEQMSRLSLFPEDVVAVTEALGCPSISYTYSEPTAFYEYTQDTCKAARERKLKNIVVSCGSIEDRAARDLYQFVDAAHVDLKGFDEDTYQKLNSGKLQPILNTLKTLKELGVWFEIINLVVPTYTDNPDTIRRMCAWIAKELGPDRPLHFSRFQPQHKLTHLAPTPVETLVKARDSARAEGLHYVYIGNVPGLRRTPETTWCPNCKKAVIERDIFAVTRMDLTDGKCNFCGNFAGQRLLQRRRVENVNIKAVVIGSHDVVAGNASGIGPIDAEWVIQGRISAALVKKTMNITGTVLIVSHDVGAVNAIGNGEADAERVI
jgi:AmmeMemoRadiSam system radical SAM enzyme